MTRSPGLGSYPMLYPAATFAAGIVLCGMMPRWGWWPAGCALAAATLLLACGRHYGAALLAMLACGCAAITARQPASPPGGAPDPAAIVEVEVAEVRYNYHGATLLAEVRGADAAWRAMIVIPAVGDVFEPGDLLEVKGHWKLPDAPTTIAGEYNPAAYYYRAGIGAICRADRWRVTGHAARVPGPIERARQRVLGAIERSWVSPDTYALLGSILVGETALLTPDRREAFAAAGLAHILALSGTHLVVITALVALILTPLRYAGRRKTGEYRRWAWLCAIAATWLYVLLSGCPPSVTRAAVMATAAALGAVSGRHTASLNSLCAAGVLILLFTPRELFGPGFQLSFAAVAAIVTLSWPMGMKRLRNPLARAANSWLTVTLAAVLGTAGIAAWHFHRFPVAFLVSNLPMALLLPVYMAGGIALVALSMAGVCPAWLAAGMDRLTALFFDIAARVNSLWWHSVDGLYVPWWALILYYGALWALYRALTGHPRRLYLAMSGITMGTFLCVCALCVPYKNERECHFAGDPFCSAWVALDGDRGYIVTDVAARHREALRLRLEKRLADVMARRGIDSLVVAGDSLDTPFVKTRGNRAAIGAMTMVMIDRPADARPYSPRPVYAVVGGHYRHGITDVWRLARPDTIILSATLDAAIEEKFAKELARQGIPYRREPERYWK